MKKIIDSLDLVVFGLVVLVGAWLVLGGAGTGKAAHERSLEAAARAGAEIKGRMAATKYEVTGGAKTLAALAQYPARIKEQWESEAAPKELGAGLFYDEDALDDTRIGRDPEVRFLAPTDLAATAHIGEIRLQWVANERTTVTVSGYVLYRTAEDGQETVLAKLGEFDFNHTDRAVTPGALYTYRVSATTDDDLLKVDGQTESERSRAVHVRGKKDYEIVIKSFDPAAKTVRVLVKKYIDDVWHEKEFDIAKGRPIGEVDSGAGIDYATQCTVVDLEFASEKITETRDEVTFLPDGRVLLEDGNPVTKRATYERRRPLLRLRLRNEVGKTEVMQFREADAEKKSE